VRKLRRSGIVLATVAVLLLALAPATLATGTVTSKTIDTTAGECVNSGDPPTLADGTTPCGAAIYGANGFTGHIYGSGTLDIVDYICTHTPGAGSFLSFGGTYTFTVYDSVGGVIGTTSETVTGGSPCTDGNNAVTSGSINVDFDANGGVVAYSISISGVTAANAQTTFAGYNSILNRVVGLGDAQANSPSVAPPGPPGEVPEAPASILLVLSAGILGLLFLRRRTAGAVARA
jgi:hypothetical protein